MNKLQSGTLTPAYGRQYVAATKAREAFQDGKDWFSPIHGRYCSIRDFASGAIVELRYGLRSANRDANSKATTYIMQP